MKLLQTLQGDEVKEGLKKIEKKMEKIREKEKQKRELEEAIGMNQGFTPTK